MMDEFRIIMGNGLFWNDHAPVRESGERQPFILAFVN